MIAPADRANSWNSASEASKSMSCTGLFRSYRLFTIMQTTVIAAAWRACCATGEGSIAVRRKVDRDQHRKLAHRLLPRAQQSKLAEFPLALRLVAPRRRFF